MINGQKTETFIEAFQIEDEEGNLQEVKETNSYKIYEKIYLALQEDEIELSNPVFKTIYNDIINYYNQNLDLDFEIDKYISETTPEITEKLTSILMIEERDTLNKWHLRKIVVEDKAVTLEQNVTETILSYRLLLICKILEENMKNVSPDVTVDNTEFLTINQDFSQLRNVIAKKLGRVLVRF